MINIKITNEEVFNKRPLLPLEDKAKWLDALKNGKYLHGEGCLCRYNRFCCLGVWSELENLPKEKTSITTYYCGQNALYNKRKSAYGFIWKKSKN